MFGVVSCVNGELTEERQFLYNELLLSHFLTDI